MAISDDIKKALKAEIDELLKADGDALQTKAKIPSDEADIGRKALIDDPMFDQFNAGITKQKASRITNKILKDISIRDWAISTIIQNRCDIMLRFSRPQNKRFDLGFKIFKKAGTAEDYTDQDKEEIAMLESFIANCGKIGGTPHEERMMLGEFIKLATRDAMTFGHVAIEKVLQRDGALHRFRPLPAESIYLVNKRASKEQIREELKHAVDIKEQLRSNNDPSGNQAVAEIDPDYYKYVQRSVDDRTLAVFSDQDMIFKLFNPQNFMDSMGYCYSLVELAIINLTNHLNVEAYNSKFFTHGYAARGVLHLKGVVTQAQLTAFRRQFHNTISGVHNSWRTPVIAGLDDVQWVPLSGSAREMEYIAFNDHILRALCSQFQIDPAEIGLDYLSHPTGKSPMQQANNEYKIEASKERGLIPILMFFEDLFNGEIIPAINPDFAEKYTFKFVGYTDLTPQAEIAQMQAEMTVHGSLNDFLRATGKTPIDSPAANLPLNKNFWELVERNYTRGEIRENFFGDKGATQRKELQYIPQDAGFIQWNKMLLDVSAQKQAMQQQQRQQEEQDMAAAHNVVAKQGNKPPKD